MKNPDLQCIFNSLPDHYLILDRELCIVAVSDAYLKITMTKRENVIGHKAFEIFPENPDDPNANSYKMAVTSLLRVFENKKRDAIAVLKYDIRRQKSAGGQYEERFWSVLNTPVFNEDREVEYVVHRVEDITEFLQKQPRKIKETEETCSRGAKIQAEVFQRAKEVQIANAQLRVANEALEKSDFLKSQLSAIVESSKDAIVSATREGIITSWNKGAESLYGYKENEVMNHSLSLLFNPNRVEELNKEIDEISKGNVVSYIETERKHKDGHNVPVSVSISPVKNKTDNVIGFCAISRDITEWKEHETMILKQQEAIQKLSLPILQLQKGLLLLPIIGLIDEVRAIQLTENMLYMIRHKRAKVILIDITGVPHVDLRVANLFMHALSATRLMGARLIITGLSADVAETLVTIGMDFSKITTLGDLQSGIEVASRSLKSRIINT